MQFMKTCLTLIVVGLSINQQALTIPTREPTGKLCENGLVYVSYGNPHNRSSYERDDRKFCCPINQTEVEYTDSESDIQYLECCPGAAKPIYDSRNQSCIEAKVVSSEPTGRLCERGIVYVTYGDPNDRNSYQFDPDRFCCPINQREFAYSDPNADKVHLECCPGAENPIYDKRNWTCNGATVVLPNHGNFKLPEPFQFFYFFKQKLCSRIEGMQGNIATGTLLRPANTEMALGRESIVENFTIVGPIKCRNRKRSTWYAFLSPRYLNLDVNSLIIKQTGDLISVPKSMSTALDGYVQTLL